ncbi:MAG: MMPL family transporter [Clostridia bacterium]|jgi:hypothetical protein|nr:MMPL family transporter [Clostridia bacterium]MDD4275561.1 MMPL family transporter [Clostridia bacterium]
MKKIAHFIVKFRLIFLVFFLLATITCGILMQYVNVNYNSVSYLPNDSDTKSGITVLYDEFGGNGIAQVMIKDLNVPDTLLVKSVISDVSGVAQVLWLDDVLSVFNAGLITGYDTFYSGLSFTLTQSDCLDYLLYLINSLPDDLSVFNPADLVNDPRLATDAGYGYFLNFLSNSGYFTEDNLNLLVQFKSQIESFYNQGNVLFTVTFSGTDYDESTMQAIEDINDLDFDTYLAGNASLTNSSIKVINSETTQALIIALIIVIIILFIMSSSYLEPILFGIVIAVAVFINMGTNVFMDSISYLTQGVASVLLLALTMDYSIFLLNRFKQEKKLGLSSCDAMEKALIASFSPISASSLTTIASFVALMFMSYKVGFDIGLVLGKGVLISLLSVFLFMPALILYSQKIIEKTEHKTFNLNFNKFSEGLKKTRFVLPFILIALIIPCIIFSYQNSFVYGNEASVGSENSVYSDDKIEIENIFGKFNQLILLLPNDYEANELGISGQIALINGVNSVQSKSLIDYSGMSVYLPASFISQFESENYTRIIINLSLPEESEATTTAIDEIKLVVQNVIGENSGYYLLGNSVSALEIKEYVEYDYLVVTIISLVLVAIILLITFRSIILPVLLVVVIQSSVWISMAIPYITNTPLVFVGYMIISAIMLGATIDYAILMTSNYLENRKTMGKFEAAEHALNQSAKAIITSASILCFAGFAMSIVSTMPAISVFGSSIGRGAVCAFVLVMILLPQALMLFDDIIRKTTLHGKKNMI